MGEDGFEVLYRSEGYYFGTGGIGTGGQDFGPIGDYIDVGQCKCAGDLAKEGGFLVIRFNHCEMDLRSPHLQGNGGKSGTGADVEDARTAAVSTQYPVPSRSRNSSRSLPFGKLRVRMTRGWEEMAGEEEGLAEVAGHDFFGMADGGQVDAGVPAE